MPSRPWPWNTLPTIRPANSGWKMSIGIALQCENRDAFACLTDQKTTFGDFSADHAALKAGILFQDWTVLFAGNDVEHSDFVIDEARDVVSAIAKNRVPKVSEVVEALDDAYWHRIHGDIERKVLKKRKFTIDSFRETGKQKCTASVYNSLCAGIEKIEISLKLLLCGFDDRGKARIFGIDGRGAPVCYDSVGMWAIGSGAHAALSSLAFQVDKERLSIYSTTVEDAIYFVSEAKFMSESSGEVGRESALLTIHRKGQKPSFLFSDDLKPVKDRWFADGAPKVPDGIAQEIGEIIKLAAEKAKLEIKLQQTAGSKG